MKHLLVDGLCVFLAWGVELVLLGYCRPTYISVLQLLCEDLAFSKDTLKRALRARGNRALLYHVRLLQRG